MYETLLTEPPHSRQQEQLFNKSVDKTENKMKNRE
jgi:hypothetical protein